MIQFLLFLFISGIMLFWCALSDWLFRKEPFLSNLYCAAIMWGLSAVVYWIIQFFFWFVSFLI